MKAPPVARRTAPGRAVPAPPRVRLPAPAAEAKPPLADRDPDGPTLLDHLRPPPLAQRWTDATRDPVSALPGRADLERRFGASLAAVRVHSGPAARSLLDHLGARGATCGAVVLLRDPADTVTAAHEAAHVLQAGPDQHAVLPSEVPLAADHPAEQEAEALARSPGPGRVRARLVPGALALRRTALLVRDPEPQAGEPAGLDDLQREPEDAQTPTDEVEAGADTPPAAVPDEASAPEAPAAEPATEPAVEEQPEQVAVEAPTATSAPGPVPPGTTRRQRTAVPAAPGPDRQIELREVIKQVQGTWDTSLRTVRAQDLTVSPDLANAPDTRPFARGPPPAVPAIRARDEVPDPQLAEPDTTSLDRAREQARRQVDAAPARAPPPDLTSLDDDQRRLRADEQRRLDDHIRQTAMAPLREVGPPAVARDGAADAARAGSAERAFRERVDGERQAARRQAAQDFGERRLAPTNDPTAGHARRLQSLELPEVDLAGQVDQARLDLVATDQNVGAVPIGQVVLVPDSGLAALHRDTDAHEATRARVDDEIGRAEAKLAQASEEAGRERATVQARARDGVVARRREWTSAGETLVDQRDREADTVRSSELARADKLQREADTRAAGAVATARAEAGRQWDEAQARARSTAQRNADRSWFQRGLDWVREQIKRLVEWIDSFLAAVRRAVTALLDAAAELAHRIVAAAHRAISAVLDRLAAALALLAANLPGKLGELARQYVERIYVFLEEMQAALDAWAERLHRGIDRTIEDLKTAVGQVLDALQTGVHEVATAVDALLANGLLAFLRKRFPTLAALVDDGLDAVVRSATDHLDAWVTAALEVTGLADLDRTLNELQIESLCAERATQESAEERANRCAAFEQRLKGALAVVDEMLASPVARQIQDFLRRHAQDEANAQLDALVDFFDFVHAVAAPVYRWWQDIQATVDRVLDTVGEVARTVWRHVATALGLDPEIDPVEALRRGIQLLWNAVVDGLRPLVDGLRAAWRWLSQESPLAPLFDLFARLPQLWAGLKDLAGKIVEGAGEWLAKAADALARTVLPLVTGALEAVSAVARVAADAVSGWGAAVLGVVEAILTWRPGLALLDAVLRAVDRITAPVRRLLAAVLTCLTATARWVADVLRVLAHDTRMLLDVAVGLVLALATFPVGMVAFLAGNVWLHVLPDCYKPALLNFLLDVAIRFVRFLPEPADVGLLILHQGLLNFLGGLRAAPDAQKVGAVDLLASLYAGNAEFAAGFVVGTLAGIWDSTGGTVVFLLQAVVWLMELPLKLATWAVGMATGTLRSDGGGADGGEDGGGPSAVPSAGDTAGPAAGPAAEPTAVDAESNAEPADVVEEAEDALKSGTRVLHGVRRPRTTGRVPRRTRTGLLPLGEAVRPQALVEQATVEAEVPRSVDRVDDTEPAATEPADTEPAATEPAATEPAATEYAFGITTVGESPAARGPNSDTDIATTEPVATVGAAPVEVAATDVTPASVDAGKAGEPSRDDTALTDRAPAAPAAPAGLTELRGVLQRLLTDGLSRDDLRQLLDAARAALRAAVGGLAQAAARLLLAELNKKGVAYELGKAVGALVGQMIAEAVLAALTAGATAAITAAKAALQGARVGTRFAGVIQKLRRVLEPVFELVKRLRTVVGELVGAVRKWLDDVLEWMRGIAKRLGGRLRKPRLPGPGRPPHLPHRPPAPAISHPKGPQRGHGPTAGHDRRLSRAMVTAKLISDGAEALGRSLPETLLALQALRMRYPFVQGFEATQATARNYDIYLIASRHKVDSFHARVERAFAEHPVGGPPAPKPPLRRPRRRGAVKAARAKFANVRDGYAARLGVKSGGQVHHAVELQVLNRYPGAFTEKELNAFSNMRGIATEQKRRQQLHGSKIREFWNNAYRQIDDHLATSGLKPGTPAYRNAVRQHITAQRDTIDHVFGQFFTEQRKTFVWKRLRARK